jgi:K+ transporter
MGFTEEIRKAVPKRRTRFARLFLFGLVFTVIGLVFLISGQEQKNGGGWFLLIGGLAICAVTVWQLRSRA